MIGAASRRNSRWRDRKVLWLRRTKSAPEAKRKSRSLDNRISSSVDRLKRVEVETVDVAVEVVVAAVIQQSQF